MTAIPLSLAMLCLGCNHVVVYQSVCPRCGSHVLMSLARWIERLEHALIERAE